MHFYLGYLKTTRARPKVFLMHKRCVTSQPKMLNKLIPCMPEILTFINIEPLIFCFELLSCFGKAKENSGI